MTLYAKETPAANASCTAAVNTLNTTFSTVRDKNGGAYASYAGSLVCSLASKQFDIWVKARELISLADTQWPVNEFVLFNWEKYSAKQLHDNNFLLGVYYLTGCARTDDSGNYQVARQIADLYKQWTGGLEIPVVGLSKATLRKNDKKARETPFFCPTVKGYTGTNPAAVANAATYSGAATLVVAGQPPDCY